MASKTMCGLKKCGNSLQNGAAVGFRIEGKLFEVKVCFEHMMQIQTAPRGSYSITADHELKPIPASPKIII